MRTLIALAIGLFAAGCVDSDPIVTGHRDAGVVDSGTPLTQIVAASDGPDDDAPDCRHCSETLSTDSARGTLCRKNATPSSASLLNDVVDCVCFDKCVQECASYCAGSTQEPVCGQCVPLKCGNAFNLCLADVKK